MSLALWTAGSEPGIARPGDASATGFSRAAEDTAADPARLSLHDFSAFPRFFEANRGQTDPRVGFLSRGPGYVIFIEPDKAVLRLSPGPAAFAGTDLVAMRFIGADESAALAGERMLAGRVNYFTSGDADRWRTNIPTFASLLASGIYPGIDVRYRLTRGRLEYDLLLEPGADPSTVRMAFEGPETVAIDDSGSLLLQTGHGVVTRT